MKLFTKCEACSIIGGVPVNGAGLPVPPTAWYVVLGKILCNSCCDKVRVYIDKLAQEH